LASKFTNFKTQLVTHKVYLGKARQCMAKYLTATQDNVPNLTRKMEGHGHKLYMDNFFSSMKFQGLDTEAKQLWQCRARHKGHARGSKMKYSQTEMRGHSSKEQGWTWQQYSRWTKEMPACWITFMIYHTKKTYAMNRAM
jgi:hypothetical protein